MASTQRPSLADLNTPRLIAESVPMQIRALQQRLREVESARVRYRAELEVLVDTAILHGVELCPALERPENGNAAGPGGADGASVRGAA